MTPMDQHAWIDSLAERFGEEELTSRQTFELLGMAREVAHRVERRITPLSTFFVGVAVGKAQEAGGSRDEALSTALETVGSLLPEPAPEDEEGS
jgi:uncharacterized protein DUF6457